MWPRTPQKATDAWLCALANWSNHSETWAAVPFCTKNCPNWHQTVLGGENWPTTCAQHVGTTWQAFSPNYLICSSFHHHIALVCAKTQGPNAYLAFVLEFLLDFQHKNGLNEVTCLQLFRNFWILTCTIDFFGCSIKNCL